MNDRCLEISDRVEEPLERINETNWVKDGSDQIYDSDTMEATPDGMDSKLDEIFHKYEETRFSRVPPSAMEDNIHFIPRASRAFRDAMCSVDEGKNKVSARARSNTYDSSYKRQCRKPNLAVHFSEDLVSDICSSTESINISEKPKKLTSILVRRENFSPEVNKKSEDSGSNSQAENDQDSSDGSKSHSEQEDTVIPDNSSKDSFDQKETSSRSLVNTSLPVHSNNPTVSKSQQHQQILHSNVDDHCSSDTETTKKRKKHKNVFERLAVPKERDSSFRPLRPRSSTQFNRQRSLPGLEHWSTSTLTPKHLRRQ